MQILEDINAREHPISTLRYLYGSGQYTSFTPDSLVYVLGKLDYDFGTETRRDYWIKTLYPKTPFEHNAMIDYLESNPQEATEIIWILTSGATPIYALRPVGSFSDEVYGDLIQFLSDQIKEGAERVSIPGIIRGQVNLQSGYMVPVIEPAKYGLFNWTTSALVNSLYGKNADSQLITSTENLLNRIYFELRNLGQTSRDRAVNYAATNALQAGIVIQNALEEGLLLSNIDAEPGVICRPDSDCWDVLLTFLNPQQQFKSAKKVYRFTIDVSGVIPVPVGEIKSWYIYKYE